MNISVAARLSGLPPKTIRFYEDEGLVSPARGANGYRAYAQADIHRLAFLARARSLGFSLDDCRQLLSLYSDENRESADVKRLASEKVQEIDQKIAALTAMRETLSTLVAACSGDKRPDCPILAEIAGEAPGASCADAPPRPTGA